MDTPWTVKVNSYAQSDLDTLDDPVRRDALAAIRDLEHDPFPPDAVKMRGATNRYRIKFYGNRYRIILPALCTPAAHNRSSGSPSRR